MLCGLSVFSKCNQLACSLQENVRLESPRTHFYNIIVRLNFQRLKSNSKLRSWQSTVRGIVFRPHDVQRLRQRADRQINYLLSLKSLLGQYTERKNTEVTPAHP
jgi:hypothetical protein